MDINKNQQTNTFTKGMNSDTSDFLLPNDQYRYAENVRPITDKDHNTGELHLVEGVLPTNIINSGEKILSFSSIRNYLVFITYKDNQWTIYKYDKNTNTKTEVFGPCSEPLWETKDSNGNNILFNPDEFKKTINTVLRWESDKNVKLYIADGIHELMAINIMRDRVEGETFDDVFGYQNMVLRPISVSISDSAGSIPSAKVQYAYRLYKENGSATTISPFSNVLSLYKDSGHGYPSEKNTNKAVDISIENATDYTGYNIQVYRINYIQLGQQPTVNLIIDKPLSSVVGNIVGIDTGASIEEVNSSEFLSYVKTRFIPKEIESKNDYMFAGNINDKQYEVDEKLKKTHWDAKAYTKGNYIIQNGQEIPVLNEDGQLNSNISNWSDITLGNLYHRQYDYNLQNQPEYNINWWNTFANQNFDTYGYSGVGENIKWKYVVSKNYKNTYRNLDTYRFGIRLFDGEGNATSVNWIGDIAMCADHGKGIAIQFDVTLPAGFDSYEIVRCNHTINDSYVISQGIIGNPMRYGSYLSNPGIFTRTPFVISTLSCVLTSIGSEATKQYNPGEDQYSRKAETDFQYAMFASPEYCYQPDDVEDVVKNYKSNVYLKEIAAYRDESAQSLYFTGMNLRKLGANPPYYPWFYPTLNTNNGYIIHASQGLWYGLAEDQNGDLIPDTYSITAGFMAWQNERNSVSGLESTINPINLSSDGKRQYVYLNKYVTTGEEMDDNVDNLSEYSIKDVEFVKSTKYSQFVNNKSFIFTNNPSFIDNTTFLNWSAPLISNINTDSGSSQLRTTLMDHVLPTSAREIHYPATDDDDPNFEDEGACLANIMYPISGGGFLMLFKIDGNPMTKFQLFENNGSPVVPGIVVTNLMKRATPYGGYNEYAIKNSVYYSHGNYSVGSGSIIVKDGDCKYQQFVYHAAHCYYDAEYSNNTQRMATIYDVLIESPIDIAAQYGNLYGIDSTSYWIQDYASSFEDYVQEKDAYLYNTAYNAEPTLMPLSSDTSTKGESEIYDTRIHYSEKKSNNEKIDNWTQFKAMNYVDVDSRFGQLTDMKLFKDKLVFWQENATGVLSVNERTLLNTADDAQIILGTGSILERFDYISTEYGQKEKQHTSCASNSALYWWDAHKREIMQYKDGYAAIPLSTVKTVKNYITDGDDTSIPSVGYDINHNEILFNVVNDKSIVYNESVDAFTAVYTFSPLFYTFAQDQLYVTDRTSVYKYGINAGNTSVWFNETPVYPRIDCVVNAGSDYVKTFDMQTFGGRFYGGSNELNERTDYRMPEHGNTPLSNITFTYNTPLKQNSSANGSDIITNIEYDYRLNIPRNGNNKNWGDRMRGKTMQYTLSSSSNSTDFSLQYITTKYRMSWT